MVETAAPIPDKSQRLAADPSASVWVSASAGTGKTKVLTERVLGLLLGGTPPERILCLTFTRAAAAQMAGRITDVLGGWTMMDEEDLSGQLEALLGHAPD
ncbi:MAG: UvrD-helicase domain-containing protein, partial [Rhodospirillales bacterium]|nr:UvrD-helicase domain-containing protein [Rhodospirillales bacterium]